MYVTDPVSPAEMLSALLKKQPATVRDTEDFRNYRHDDHLCTSFQRNVAAILEVYNAYGFDCHDIQGMTDHGVDVLLKYKEDDGAKFIGLQIKSYDELEAYKQKAKDENGVQREGLPSKLRAQYTDAVEDLRVEHYFIVLCGDAKAHRKQVRYISSKLVHYQKLTIISPTQAYAFFRMSPAQVEAATIRALCQDDLVLKEAVNAINDPNEFYSYLLIWALCKVHSGKHVLGHSDFRSALHDWVEMGGEDDYQLLATALSNLEAATIAQYDGNNDYAIDVSVMPIALSALYFDIRTRRAVTEDGAAKYIAELLEVLPQSPYDDEEADEVGEGDDDEDGWDVSVK